MEIIVRSATEQDAESISEIYRHHVLSGTASYDVKPPSAEFHLEKLRSILCAGWPFLVAEVDGEVAGYAYVTQFRDRAAYQFTAEDSIYVHPGRIRQGVGKALLDELVDRASASGFRTIVAVIGGAEPASIGLHRTCGFHEVGRLGGVGFKFGRWLDNVYMQRDLFCARSAQG